MTAAPAVAPPAAPPTPRPFDFGAGLLSYLVPGLGQIVQGRRAKGVLFLVSLYTLFFYGMWLGSWSNVYYPALLPGQPPAWNLPGPLACLVNRPQFAAQFFMGIAAWPAVLHHRADAPGNDRGDFDGSAADFARKFQQSPSEAELNKYQRLGDKHWDLGWVYTVIAGVLNVLVIYDAACGPTFLGESPELLKEGRR